jgi:hypothetical protein
MPWLCLLLFLGACSLPPDHALQSPDGSAWVRMDTVPADPAQDRWVATQRVTLQRRWSRDSLLLLDGVENLCGSDLRWLDAHTLGLRLPVAAQPHWKAGQRQDWDGIGLRLLWHEDQVLFQRNSADLQRRLVVLSACDTQDWNLYLRRPGEPLYNDAMQTGWDDPDVFGGFGPEQAPLSLEWTGPRSAVIVVPGKQYRVTLRNKVGDVAVQWKFDKKYKPPDPVTRKLAPIKP